MRDNNRLVSLGNNPEYDALLQCVGDTLEKGGKGQPLLLIQPWFRHIGKLAARLWNMNNTGMKGRNMAPMC